MNLSGSSKPHGSVATLHQKYEGRMYITNTGADKWTAITVEQTNLRHTGEGTD